MSATNRGKIRKVLDNYLTPEYVIHNFLDNYGLDMNNLYILDPCAGSGNFGKVIKEKYPNSYISATEIREEEKSNLSLYYNDVFIKNFFDLTSLNFDVIITNPPYSCAKELIEFIFKINKNKNTKIITLLRTAFLESKIRYDFWQKYPLNGLYTLSKRPSFFNKRTDATSYSWFIWDGTNKQTIKVI